MQKGQSGSFLYCRGCSCRYRFRPALFRHLWRANSEPASWSLPADPHTFACRWPCRAAHRYLDWIALDQIIRLSEWPIWDTSVRHTDLLYLVPILLSVDPLTESILNASHCPSY